MKMTKLLFIGTWFLAAVAAGYGQTAESAQPQRVFGYVDSATGNFHPLNRKPLSQDARATLTPTTGKFVVNVTIDVSSALPTTAIIDCEVDAEVKDTTSGDFGDVVFATATRTGNTATCTLNLPYSWDLANASSDLVSVNLKVGAGVLGTANTPLYTETFTAPVTTIKVPANGTTTTENVTTTI